MVEPQRGDADEQKGTQHDPEDAQPPRRQLCEGFSGHRNPVSKMLANCESRNNGTKVLGLADKPHKNEDLMGTRRRASGCGAEANTVMLNASGRLLVFFRRRAEAGFFAC